MDRRFKKDQPFATIDGGASKLYVRFGLDKNDVAPFSRADFLSCRWMSEPRFTNIKQYAGEYAHLAVPQTKHSLAQIFSARQLTELYDRMDKQGASLFYLPEKQVRKIAWRECPEYARLITKSSSKKSDEMDTMVWFKFLLGGYTDNLQPAIRDVGEHSKNTHDYVQLVSHVNVTLNVLRHGNYMRSPLYADSEFFPDGVDHVAGFIRDYCEVIDKTTQTATTEKSKCFDELMKTLGMPTPKSRDDKHHGAMEIMIRRPLYPMSTAAASMICQVTGEILRKRNGKFRSVDEIMKVIGSSPNHGRMGVARSNIYWWCTRNVTISRCKKDKCPIEKDSDRPYDPKQLNEKQEYWHKKTMKDIKLATRLCVRYTQKCLQGKRVADTLF